jgi:two-component system LytT family sensor kinase
MRDNLFRITKKQVWAITSIFWFFIAITAYLQDITITSMEGYHNNYVFTAVLSLGWLLWIPLTLLVVQLSRLHPIHRSHVFKSVLVHFGFSILITALHFLLNTTLVVLIIKGFYPNRRIDQYVPTYMLMTLHTHFIIYFLVVAVHQGFTYIREFQLAVVRNASLESKLVEAQNQALKMQIRPHFLFNTHHSIISLLHSGRKEEAIEMLIGLSDLLRRTLDQHNNDLVSIEDELSLIKLYLSIQEIRFKDRLKISYEVDETSYVQKIPPFTLQPLIENAIIHGIEPYSDSGLLKISIHHKLNSLHIRVEDDGIGVGKSQLREGIGLSNIKSRLENIYGDAYRFSIRPNDIKGTRVELLIPLLNTPAA